MSSRILRSLTVLMAALLGSFGLAACGKPSGADVPGASSNVQPSDSISIGDIGNPGDSPSSSRPTDDGTTDTEPDGSMSPVDTSSPVTDTSGDGEYSGVDVASPEECPVEGVDPIDLDDLPIEAIDTLRLIASDGPYPFDRDGLTFQNRERLLPKQDRGYYREYTVIDPSQDDRGPRRVVTGECGEAFYTADHYDSFGWIQG